MSHVWPVLKSHGLTRITEITKKATIEDLKMMVGKDATKLHFELEKHLLLEMNLFKLTDS